MPTTVPAARTANLVVSSAADETLVYDRESHHIHHLNVIAADIWRLCDGQRSLADITAATRLQESVVAYTLRKLADANLLDGTLAFDSRPTARSRRWLLGATITGGVAIAVPAVVSISAPAAASQLSGCVSAEQCYAIGEEGTGIPCYGADASDCAFATCQPAPDGGYYLCKAGGTAPETSTSDPQTCVPAQQCEGSASGTPCYGDSQADCAFASCQLRSDGYMVCAASPPANLTPTPR